MKSRNSKPSSIRLTPAADEQVSNWVKATGWSIAACINHAILIAGCVHRGDPTGWQTERQRLVLAINLKIVDDKAAAAKSKLRAAAKGGAK